MYLWLAMPLFMQQVALHSAVGVGEALQKLDGLIKVRPLLWTNSCVDGLNQPGIARGEDRFKQVMARVGYADQTFTPVGGVWVRLDKPSLF